MTAKRYWSDGIEIGYASGPTAWSGDVRYYGHHNQPGAVESGVLHVACGAQDREHRSSIRRITNTLLDSAEQFGIEFPNPGLWPGDQGDTQSVPGWRDLIKDEAAHRGWWTSGLDEDEG